MLRHGAADMRPVSKTLGRRVRCLAAAVLGCLFLGSFCLPPEATAQGVGRVLRPITRSVADQRRIIQGSEVSRLVVRPRLDIVRGKKAGGVVSLSLNGDRSLLFAVLADGTARLWDLERGVQLGGVIGRSLIAGAVGGSGDRSEAVAVSRNGSVTVIRPDGSTLRAGEVDAPLGGKPAVVLSAEGGVVAFRADAAWRVMRAGRVYALPGAASAFLPVLSPDGTWILYVTDRGTVAAGNVASGGAPARLGNCVRNAAVTTGAFLPGGSRVMLGDRRGQHLPVGVAAGGEQDAGRFITRKRAHRGPVGAIAASGDGRFVATRDRRGTVRLWTAERPMRRQAAFELAAAASGPLVLDFRRRWLFAAEADGTVGVYAYSRREAKRVAGLISTNDGGWTVLDPQGRFDGPQNGVDALLWAGDTADQTLPVDAFSEAYFEPGLLAKLDEEAPHFLNDQVRDMSDDGYVLPPAVSIDPIDERAIDGQGLATVRVRLQDPDYPLDELQEIRLYHNGKLVNRPAQAADGGIAEYAVRLLPGANTFRAIGVGLSGIEGQPATAAAGLPVPEPRRPRMHVVSVGINAYRDPLTELFSARNDAEAIVSALHDREDPRFDDVAATTLLDSLARATAIEESIARGIRARPVMPEDVLVVYFAGHGYSIEEEDGWEWYLLPYTESWNVPKATRQTIRRYGIPSRRLMNYLTATAARRVFLILDSCRSGAVIEAVATDEGRAPRRRRGTESAASPGARWRYSHPGSLAGRRGCRGAGRRTAWRAHLSRARRHRRRRGQQQGRQHLGARDHRLCQRPDAAAVPAARPRVYQPETGRLLPRRRFCCRRVIEWHRQVSACECGEPEAAPNWTRIIGSTN